MSGQLTPQDVELEAHREEKRLLSVEVERLRAELDYAAVQHAAMQTELERLQAENEALRHHPTENALALAQGREQATGHQRDALADALMAVRQRIAIEGPPPQMMDLCVNAGQRLGAATAWDWLRADLRSRIDAALRLADRLPEEGS